MVYTRVTTAIVMWKKLTNPNLRNCMEGQKMNGFWKKTGKRFSSALLALVLVLSLMPAAMAEPATQDHEHGFDSYGMDDSSHWQVCRIAWCSIFVVMIWFPLARYASAAAFSAQLSDSLPQPVK